MLTILNLPHEIILEVFQQLSPIETISIIHKLKGFPIDDITSLILDLLYKRLLNGKLIITLDNTSSEHDTLLTVELFEKKFLTNNHENAMFQRIRPRFVEIQFIRHVNDYSNFLDGLYTFNYLLENQNEQIKKYFAQILQLSFHVDGNLVLTDNPISISTIILKIFINLSSHNDLNKSIKHLTIKSTDIGNLFITKWPQLFKNFIDLKTLNLSNNLIKSNLENQIDILGQSFGFPYTLKELILDNNLIDRISANFCSSLPKGLETLSLNKNNLASLGFNNNELFQISKTLPCLKSLRLNCNYSLVLINPAIFKDLLVESFTIEVKSCNIEVGNLRELKSISLIKVLT